MQFSRGGEHEWGRVEEGDEVGDEEAAVGDDLPVSFGRACGRKGGTRQRTAMTDKTKTRVDVQRK